MSLVSTRTMPDILELEIEARRRHSIDYGKVLVWIGATGISWGVFVMLGKIALVLAHAAMQADRVML
jgi:hypothetical protein